MNDDTQPKPAGEPVARITEYLAAGGLLNPKLMEHEKVRDLLIECRDALTAEKSEREIMERSRDAWQRQVGELGQQLAAEREKVVKDFAGKILHGDEVHRVWLNDAAEAYINGFSLPAPRSAPITDDAVNEAWEELLSELDVGFITDGKTYECGQCGGKGKSEKEVKHAEGCIHPALDKVSELNRKHASKLREQLDAERKKTTALSKVGK